MLDESDRLLSPDFLPQVEPIIDACTHKDVQKCFLSATMPAGSETIAKKWLRDGGVRVVVGLKSVFSCFTPLSALCSLSSPPHSSRALLTMQGLGGLDN